MDKQLQLMEETQTPATKTAKHGSGRLNLRSHVSPLDRGEMP